MNYNTKPSGWSREEMDAARREAKRTGKTLGEVMQESIRRLIRFSGRGNLYRMEIV